jgi:hypothetical protein
MEDMQSGTVLARKVNGKSGGLKTGFFASDGRVVTYRDIFPEPHPV